MKKVLCLAIALLITICGLSFNVSATEDDGMLYMDNYGVCIDDYNPNYPSYSEEPQSSVSITKYDPRNSNYTTPIKNQSPHGACGIFATTASFELASYMQTGLKYQYSEEAARFVLSDNLKKANGLTNESVSGFYTNTPYGAWSFSAVSSYYTNINNPIIDHNTVEWVAPVLLSDVPYTTITTIPTGYWPDNMDYSNANAFVSGTEWVREDLIRDKILQYGAVYTVYLADKIEDPNSYNSSTGAWYSLTADSNHAVAVVGWDDNYSRYNFNSNRIPPGDGAWLIKNSWGTNYGEDGYGWISYFDESFNYRDQARVVTAVEPLSKNEYMLSHDYMPLNNKYGVTHISTSVYTCNVYDVSEYVDRYDSINKVLFYSNCVNGTYELYIVPVNTDGTIPGISELGEPLSSGSILKDGYLTVDLQNPYSININVEKYAIIVKHTGDSEFIVPREYSYTGDYGGCNAKIKAGESYYNIGNGWNDVNRPNSNFGYGNYCIRPILERATPITQDSSLSLYSTNNQGEALSITVNLNGNQLYSIKKGSTVLYEDVSFTRNGNVITFKETFMDGLSTTKNHDITFTFTDGADQILQILPRQLSTVSINGKVALGQTLTVSAICDDGTVPPSQQLTYQWQSSEDGNTWTNIGGAIYSTYTLTDDEQQKYIRCQVTVSSGNGIATSTKTTASTTTKVVLYGDVDLDGFVTAMDATEIQLYIGGRVTLTDEQFLAADVDDDNEVTVMDAVEIQLFVAGKITSFPVEN